MSSPSDRTEQQHIHTPLRARVRVLYTYSSLSQNQIAQRTGIAQSTVSRIINDCTSRRAGYHLKKQEKRGRFRRFTKEDIDSIEEFLDRNGFEGKQTNWEELPNAIGLEGSWSLNIIKKEL